MASKNLDPAEESMLRDALENWHFDIDWFGRGTYRLYNKSFSERTKEIRISLKRFFKKIWLKIEFVRVDYNGFGHSLDRLIASVDLSGSEAQKWSEIIQAVFARRQTESQHRKERDFFLP